MIRFEWDAEKAKRNAAKHGVRFEEAISVFDDPDALFYEDLRFEYGEERFVVVGNNGLKVLFVVHTERGEVIRLISARRATRQEMDAYAKNADPRRDG